MHYVDFGPLRERLNRTADFAALAAESGRGREAEAAADRLEEALRQAEAAIRGLDPDPLLREREPDAYAAILALCDGGNAPKRPERLEDRMAGAVLGRFAGCTLGVPVENWPVKRMEALAAASGMAFPPEEYWRQVDRPWDVQYGVDARQRYTRDGMDGVPVDDDITYTLLGLLILEAHGFDFTTADVGRMWIERLPCACTAEDVALRNLKAGIPAAEAADRDNPFCQWIGADIRADGFAYAAAGDPRLAAALAYRDAYLSHRRNGIYGEMFFAAAIAAAFVTDDPLEAVRAGLREIPRDCALHRDVEWALETGGKITDFRQARRLIDERFAGMHPVHTNNNACLTIFGLYLGRGDFTATIGNTVAMGLDNDCTAATAGSLLGATVGRAGIDPRWTAGFHDQVRTYMRGARVFSIQDVVARFVRLTESRF